jgi:integrase
MSGPEAPDIWSEAVGELPYKVTVYERVDRGMTLYLKWRESGNWVPRSLGKKLRTKDGRIIKERQAWALAQAELQRQRLIAGLPDAEKPKRPLTLGEAKALITDEARGKYPVDTPHRREVERALDFACATLGAGRTWASLLSADFVHLWRARMAAIRAAADDAQGHRGAEVTMQRLFAVARWLRDNKHIGEKDCIPASTWKASLKADWTLLYGNHREPEPHRPRYTLEESRRLLEHAAEVDPRYDLLLRLGVGLRPGQVRRARRSDLDLERATLTVYGLGNKRGEVVKLTAGQLRAVRATLDTGYLREIEAACADYYLFPAGQLPGRRRSLWKDPAAGVRSSKGPTTPTATVARHANAEPIDPSAIRTWHRAAERLAKIAPVKGRGPYGIKRAAVDHAKKVKISREGLKALGGWSDTQVPDRIYADQEAEYARDEAREVRADILGERDDETA